MNIRNIILLVLLSLLPVMGQKFEKSGGARTINVTNNPDNSTLEAKPGNKIGVKESYLDSWIVATDTTTLDNLNGSYVHLLSLGGTNYRGGGALRRALKATYPIDNGLSFSHSHSDSVWVRASFLDGEPLSAVWFGVTGDGTTDDRAALDRTEVAARTYKRQITLPGGNLRIASDWNIVNTSQDIGITILGQGAYNTVIKPDSGFGVIIGNGAVRTRNVTFGRLSIQGSHTAKTDTALYMNTTANCNLTDIRIGASGAEAFYWGVYAYRTEHTVFTNLDILYTRNGIKFKTNSNGNVLISSDIGQMDSICIQFDNGSHGNVITGGEGGNSPIYLSCTDISKAMVNGVNVEQVDSAAVILTGSSKATINGLDLLNSSAGGWFAIVGTGDLTLVNYAIRSYANSRGYIKKTGTAAFIKDLSAQQHKNNGVTPFNETDLGSPEQIWPVRPYPVYPENTGALGSTNYDENRGLLWGKFLRSTISGGDQLNWIGKTDSGHVNYTLNANAAIFNRQNAAYSQPVNQKIYTGYEQVTTTTGDSTEVTIDTDAAGVLSYLHFDAPVVYRVGGGLFKMDGFCVKSFNAGTGTVVYVIWHERAADKNAAVRVYASLRVRD